MIISENAQRIITLSFQIQESETWVRINNVRIHEDPEQVKAKTIRLRMKEAQLLCQQLISFCNASPDEQREIAQGKQ